MASFRSIRMAYWKSCDGSLGGLRGRADFRSAVRSALGSHAPDRVATEVTPTLVERAPRFDSSSIAIGGSRVSTGFRSIAEDRGTSPTVRDRPEAVGNRDAVGSGATKAGSAGLVERVEVADGDQPGPEGLVEVDLAPDPDLAGEQAGGGDAGGDAEVGDRDALGADQGVDLLAVDLPRRGLQEPPGVVAALGAGPGVGQLLADQGDLLVAVDGSGGWPPRTAGRGRRRPPSCAGRTRSSAFGAGAGSVVGDGSSRTPSART